MAPAPYQLDLPVIHCHSPTMARLMKPDVKIMGISSQIELGQDCWAPWAGIFIFLVGKCVCWTMAEAVVGINPQGQQPL